MAPPPSRHVVSAPPHLPQCCSHFSPAPRVNGIGRFASWLGPARHPLRHLFGVLFPSGSLRSHGEINVPEHSRRKPGLWSSRLPTPLPPPITFLPHAAATAAATTHARRTHRPRPKARVPSIDIFKLSWCSVQSVVIVAAHWLVIARWVPRARWRARDDIVKIAGSPVPPSLPRGCAVG